MYQKLFIGCLLLLFISSCKKNRQPDVIVDIEDDFYIDMFEDISNGEQRFQLEVTTIKDQTCLNYQIDYILDYDKQFNTIELVINDLIEPADCIAGTSSAKLTVPFGTVGLGSYSFDINLKDAVLNTGRLTVFSDSYLVEMNTNDGIEMVNDRLYRIPKNTAWGYVAYDNGSSETAAQNVIASFQNLSSTFSVENNGLYKSGYYGYFNLTEDRAVLLNEEINYNNYIPFLFQHNDIAEIEAAFEDACMQNQNLEIRLFDDTGKDELCGM